MGGGCSESVHVSKPLALALRNETSRDECMTNVGQMTSLSRTSKETHLIIWPAVCWSQGQWNSECNLGRGRIREGKKERLTEKDALKAAHL